jgi:hypothetical protein
MPFSATPFMQAHDFLKRHAPDKRLVLAGWGGVTRHFESLHHRLPEDIVFSALSDSLGWDPGHGDFGKLGSRDRWPVPWIEDDPSMWFPQFRASRFEKDMKHAKELGCQGAMSTLRSWVPLPPQTGQSNIMRSLRASRWPAQIRLKHRQTFTP